MKVTLRPSERLNPAPPPAGSRNQAWKCQVLPGAINAAFTGSTVWRSSLARANSTGSPRRLPMPVAIWMLVTYSTIGKQLRQ